MQGLPYQPVVRLEHAQNHVLATSAASGPLLFLQAPADGVHTVKYDDVVVPLDAIASSVMLQTVWLWVAGAVRAPYQDALQHLLKRLPAPADADAAAHNHRVESDPVLRQAAKRARTQPSTELSALPGPVAAALIAALAAGAAGADPAGPFKAGAAAGGAPGAAGPPGALVGSAPLAAADADAGDAAAAAGDEETGGPPLDAEELLAAGRTSLASISGSMRQALTAVLAHAQQWDSAVGAGQRRRAQEASAACRAGASSGVASMHAAAPYMQASALVRCVESGLSQCPAEGACPAGVVVLFQRLLALLAPVVSDACAGEDKRVCGFFGVGLETGIVVCGRPILCEITWCHFPVCVRCVGG